MPTVPDDDTLASAAYGSSHLETLLAQADADRILEIVDSRISASLERIPDMELADVIMDDAPELVYSDTPLSPQVWDEGHIETIEALRDFVRGICARELVESWKTDIDRRGRLVGLGEHSARIAASGTVDPNYRLAVSRYGRERRWSTTTSS